ncbi:APC family permease [Gordonia rhizosphera]|uniref:Putative amino acid transporter n=1 Tax=Gordonia rhizosphera NBRC 16068 TaxID=1108045 RepID=K6VYW4_9ACTN|nr:APC family permease [Gordonia rhizosphera]GAB92095.1 putative amino acid transporter [Gordonia rhizosphera NBRC 16068]
MPSPRRSSQPKLYVDESSVDGLNRRQLPFIPVFAQSVAAIAPAGTSAVTPLFVIAALGGFGGLVAFVVALAVAMLVAACIRPMAQRVAVVGGLYSYVAQGLGARFALPTAWSAIVGYGSVSMAGLLAVGLYLTHIAVSVGVSATVPVVSMSVIVALAAVITCVLMVRGIKVSATATLVIEVVSVVIMVGLMVAVAIVHRDAPWSEVFAPHGEGALGIGTVVAVSAFVGFESATTLSSEAQKPFLTVPRTLRWTPVAAGAIYLLAVVSQSVAMFGAPDDVRSSSTPLAALFLSEGSRAASVVLDVGIATSFFACTLASVNALVRVLFCLARERVAPGPLGRAHPRFRTPAVAIVAAMTVVAVVPLVFLWSGGDPEAGIRAFLTLSALGYMGSYLTASLAAPVFLRDIGEPSRRIVWLGAIAGLVLGGLLIGAAFADIGHSTVLFVVYIASMAVVVAAVVVVARVAPDRLRRVGVFDETRRSDVLTLSTLR